jgi:hypothetical protein
VGYGGDKNDIWGLMFFNTELRAACKSWVRVLYGEKNLYTGVALKNEDSLLFWATAAMKPEQLSTLQGEFALWLGNKYGSL